MAVLPNLEQQLAEAQALIAKQQELLNALNKPKALSLKVSEKGALSVYGLGRFPITLYKSQWPRLLSHAKAIEAFISANDHLLKGKDD